MANFLLLYHGGGMPESGDEKQKVMAKWGEWMNQNKPKLVDPGNPTSSVKVVNQTGTADFSGDKVTGYSIVKTTSLDEAIEVAKAVPLVADGGSVDVYETFEAM